jgi:geranylgeranyl pyrophosphate synthase
VTAVAQDVGALAGARTLPFLAAVEERLAAQLADDAVGRASRETLAAGGKRLRPLLVLIAAPLDARELPELEVAACAAELVHMATLVHDDVLDAAPLRRGHATVWARHGEALARATGDHLFALAFAGLARTGSREAVALLAQAALDLARGEALQSEQARRPDTPVDAYLERCLFKTGRLFAAACALGGLFGGLDENAIAALGRFGEQLGIAFQLADDVLDCDGDPEATGKALGVDLLDGTVTLPLLLAAQRDERVAAAIVDRERAAADVVGVLALVAATGAVADARRAVQEHADAARAAVARLPDRSDRRALEAIVQAATTRDH